MIRVNLLAAEQTRAKAPAFSGISANKLHIIGLVLVAACVGRRRLPPSRPAVAADLRRPAARSRPRPRRSASRPSPRNWRKFEAQTALLQQRVALIEQLRKGQRSPVTLLDQVSRQLPDRVWLTQLAQAGADVTLEGRTMTLTALSDLIGNLENSGSFARPVEIVNTEVENGKDEADLMKFTVRAYVPAGRARHPGRTHQARSRRTPAAKR